MIWRAPFLLLTMVLLTPCGACPPADVICHGTGLVSGGMTPELRYTSAATHEAFKQIVLYGARAKNGMAPFADVLSEADAEAIPAYIIDEARKQLQAGNHETH